MSETKLLSPSRVKEITERVEKATAGPWCGHREHQVPSGWQMTAAGKHLVFPIADNMTPEDVGFCAHSRTDIPDLLEERKLLVGIVRKLGAALRVQAGETSYWHTSAEFGNGVLYGWNPECKPMRELMADPNVIELLKEQG